MFVLSRNVPIIRFRLEADSEEANIVLTACGIPVSSADHQRTWNMELVTHITQCLSEIRRELVYP